MLRDPLPQPVCCFVPGRKCLLRTAHLTAVGEGNHEGTFECEAVRRNSTIGIYHFPVRSAAQFERKVRRGGEALSRDTERPAGTAWHWRRWHYKLAQEGFGATIADALPSARQIEQGRLEGRFEEVTIIRDLILEPAGLARYA
jgi:hypothetical protein